MSGYMKVLAEYSDKAGHKDRTGHIKRITGIITAIIMLITTAVIVPVFCCAEEVSGPDKIHLLRYLWRRRQDR